MKKSEAKKFFTTALLAWDRTHNKRTMPWKAEKDPYKIWLSEIILQQTRVAQGLSYYERFTERFPTVESLAAADDSTVFKLWEGLGYYSRCRNLLETARTVSITHNGEFPRDYSALLKLKGVGPYTAAAIASFAFDLPYAVIDGNVFRVLSRWFGVSTPIDSTEGKKEFADLAQKLLKADQPAAYNQAIMDFGATICTPKTPDCPNCPLREDCVARKTGRVETLPIKAKKLIKKQRRLIYLVASFAGKYYVRQRQIGDVWAGLWEFILFEEPAGLKPETFDAAETIIKAIPAATPLHFGASLQQQLTHQRLEVDFFEAELAAPFGDASYTALTPKDLTRLAFPQVINRFLDLRAARREQNL